MLVEGNNLSKLVQGYYSKRILEQLKPNLIFNKFLIGFEPQKGTFFNKFKWFCEDNIWWRFKLHIPDSDD